MKDTHSTYITDGELSGMQRRCDAAQPAPWKSYVEGRDHSSGGDVILTGEDENRGNDLEVIGASPADQDFIAHARQDMPRLIAEVKRLRKLLTRQQQST